MAFRSKTRLYVSIALVVGLVVAYSNSQPHGHTHGGNGDHGHAHDDHGHAHNENPAYKYSRAANEPAKQPEQHHGHSHDDDHHGHHHAHSHGSGGGHHHAHSHGSGGGHHHAHSHGSGEQQQKRAAESTTVKPAASAQKPGARDRFTIALHAMGSTALISIAPFLILFFIPLNDNNIENQALLKVLLAFASGSLLGDAFLHLIPHSLEPHDHSSHAHSHSHSHQHNHGHDHHDHSQQTNVGLWVMSGILTFLLVEKLIVSVKGDGHSHSHSPQTEKEKIGAAKKNEEKSASDEDDDDSKPKKSGKKDTSKKKVEEKKKEEPKHEGIKVAGYLNLAADFAHNFTDGLAIGASFLAGQNLGIITTFTILFHEVPHEIGDFAILIQSGCSKKKAIFLQLVTALGACSGTLLSLLFESAISGFATSCILPFTAGGFIYIATVTIIPELKESTGFFQSIKEILALVAGVGMMIVISYME